MTPKPPLTDEELKRITGQFNANAPPKPREWTFDEICESQDFNHTDLFVEHSAYAAACRERDNALEGIVDFNNKLTAALVYNEGLKSSYDDVKRKYVQCQTERTAALAEVDKQKEFRIAMSQVIDDKDAEIAEQSAIISVLAEALETGLYVGSMDCDQQLIYADMCKDALEKYAKWKGER